MEQIIGTIIVILFCILMIYLAYLYIKSSRQRAALSDLFNQYIQQKISLEKEKEIEAKIEKLIIESKMQDYDVVSIKNSIISSVISKIGEDLIFTDEEARYLDSCVKKLGVKLSVEEERNLEEWREHAEILKGHIIPIQTDCELPKNELAYFSNGVSLKELKHYNGRGKYAMPYDQLVEIATGEIILTNNRILFIGPLKNITIKFDKILKLIPHKDGIELHRGTGNPYYFLFPEPIKFFFMYTYLTKGKVTGI